MRRRFMLLVCGILMLTLLLPFQAAAAESGTETLLYRFNGTILDFDESRIVWREAGDKVLLLYNRSDKSQVKLYDATGSGYTIHSAKLSSDGVVFTLSITHSSGWPTYRYVYYWNDGNVQKLADGDVYEVKGNFAVFTNRVLDLAAGQSRSLPNSYFANTNRFDLSADGTVVYMDRIIKSNLYKSLPDGTLTTYVPPNLNYYGYSGPLTDGKNIIYKVLLYNNSIGYSKWAIRMRDADDKITTLAIKPVYSDHFANPRTTYQINNGWIAYQEYNLDTDNWTLYVRSPEGETKPVFETPSQTWKQSWYARDGIYINQLGADGSVMYSVYTKRYTNTQSYLYSPQENKQVRVSGSPGQFQYREHVFSGPGEKQYRYGAWYRLDGGSLYAIRI